MGIFLGFLEVEGYVFLKLINNPMYARFLYIIFYSDMVTIEALTYNSKNFINVR